MFSGGQHLPIVFVPLPYSRNIGEATKQRKSFSKIYPGGEVCIDILQNTDGICFLTSIARKMTRSLACWRERQGIISIVTGQKENQSSGNPFGSTGSTWWIVRQPPTDSEKKVLFRAAIGIQYVKYLGER